MAKTFTRNLFARTIFAEEDIRDFRQTDSEDTDRRVFLTYTLVEIFRKRTFETRREEIAKVCEQTGRG